MGTTERRGEGWLSDFGGAGDIGRGWIVPVGDSIPDRRAPLLVYNSPVGFGAEIFRAPIRNISPTTKNQDMKISIAHDFSPSPRGRARRDGPVSGEAFRDDVLLPALKRAEREGDLVTVSLDDIPTGPSPSFLHEAFGGLVWERAYSPARLRKLMRLEASSPVHNPFYLNLIWRYVDEAGRRKAAGE